VDLEYRLGDIETDSRDRLHFWLLQIVGALTAPTFMALTCRWRSRSQHQYRTLIQFSAEMRLGGSDGKAKMHKRFDRGSIWTMPN
jgi:hypothetical protein